MSTMSGGPNIVTNGLVLHLDAANTKSFRGEPTTNLVTPFPTSTSTAIGYNFGYEYDATVVPPPSSGIIFSDRNWIKCVKNLGTNGRSGFLGISGLIVGGTYEWSAYIYCDDSRVTALSMGSDNGAISYNLRNSAFNASNLGVVQRVSSSFFSVNGSQIQGIRGGSTDAIGSTFYITGMQVENKTYATPVVSGSRGTTVATGGGWADRTPNANHGELVNGPTYNAANGGSIVFDGTNDYISGTSISNQFTGDMTAEAWIKVTSNPTDWVRIVGTGGNGGNNRTFGLWYATDRRLLWQRYGSVDPSIYPLTPLIPLNDWAHVVATTSGTSHALYLNGLSIGTSTATGPWSASNEAITIGFAGFHTYTTSNISSVKLYNRGLSAQEILQNYNSQKSRFGLP